ncbi:hypothetical protein HNP38_001378 [Chryseobacterium defluvii]|uniref:Ribonuclease n=1 Tax=Chryseobacterium defluvii TaxID=160396 RepID=A0A840KA68_9FLAO|nr:ribonuclease domain-containing protein [Chryseobacterium defluvii]MBB4806106.1 hypothetical protein [Chryseobacterium defluvii]
MSDKKPLLFSSLTVLFALFALFFVSNCDKKDILAVDKNSGYNIPEQRTDGRHIAGLTEEKKVISYVKRNHRLPDYYITKSEARRLGWNPSKGNLCEVLPGKAIGGDKFSNRERKLPGNEKYFEADVNYRCGNRNADRIVYTKDGDVYLTKNHYKSFEKQ